jgi:hypothetical protein
MTGLYAAVEATRHTVELWVALVVLGLWVLAVGSYTWWQRDVWAPTIREDFERKGMSWLRASRLVPDGRFKRIARFFGVAWIVLGASLIVTGIVVLAVQSWSN